MPREPQYADPQRYADLVGFKGSWRELWWNADFLDLMVRRLRLLSARQVLDVGCGAGHWGRSLLPHLAPEAELVGVDREPTFLELARQASEPARTRFVTGSAEELPFEDASFDLVTCQTLMIHVAAPALVISEVMRVLRPGGVLLAAEPDNRAGNIALLGGEPRPSDQDVLSILDLLLACERGKLALGEGDQSIGGRLPGLFAAGGLAEVVAYTNDRCVSFYPPYERGDMVIALEQEQRWASEGASILFGAREDNWRFFEADGGARADFDARWAAVQRWMDTVREGVAAGEYHAARGFVMYLVAGSKPA